MSSELLDGLVFGLNLLGKGIPVQVLGVVHALEFKSVGSINFLSVNTAVEFEPVLAISLKSLEAI